MSTPNQLGFFDLTTRDEALSQKGDPVEQLAQVVAPGKPFDRSWP